MKIQKNSSWVLVSFLLILSFIGLLIPASDTINAETSTIEFNDGNTAAVDNNSAISFSNTFGLNAGNQTSKVPANVLNVMGFKNTAGKGKITRVEIFVDEPDPVGKVRMGVYTSTPVLLIQDLGEVPVVNGWTSIEGLDIPVEMGIDYGLGFIMQNDNGVRTQDNQPHWCYSVAYPYGSLPFGRWSSNDVPPGGVNQSYRFVMRVTVFSPDP